MQGSRNSAPYDQQLARLLVRPLVRTAMTPNQITSTTLLLALAAAWLFASGEPGATTWAAGLFVLARFLDHFDGELARQTGRGSQFGYYFDYVAGGVSYSALFIGVGIGLSKGPLGDWALLLAAAGTISAILSLVLNLDLDRQQKMTDGATVGYPALAGFELEDGIYLLAPVTWAGFLQPFFVAAGIGAVAYLLWTFRSLLRLRAARAG